MKSIDCNKVKTPAPDWLSEYTKLKNEFFDKLEAEGIKIFYPKYEAVPIGRILAFAKAARKQPDIWEQCIVEAERRKHEISDPNSELRLNDDVQEDTNSENFILEWNKFVYFIDWFLLKLGLYGIDDYTVYTMTQYILRMWNNGTMDENDETSFVEWFKTYLLSAVIFDDKV